MPNTTTAPFVEVWAEEPDCRVKVEPWGNGAILTISTPWLPNPVVASVGDWRWRRLIARPLTDVQVEAGAVALWHKFAPSHHLGWEDEPHKAEYRDAARAVMGEISNVA